MQIDAAIVRIMKTRKLLSHTILITELFHQVNLAFDIIRVYIVFLDMETIGGNHAV